LGGIAPLPFMTEAVKSFDPLLASGAHAALSPNLGGMPVWQPLHDFSNTTLPSAPATEPMLNKAARTVIPTIATFIFSPSR
jgi:hypothetical protein